MESSAFRPLGLEGGSPVYWLLREGISRTLTCVFLIASGATKERRGSAKARARMARALGRGN